VAVTEIFARVEVSTTDSVTALRPIAGGITASVVLVHGQVQVAKNDDVKRVAFGHPHLSPPPVAP
jgi:hypothetical protein